MRSMPNSSGFSLFFFYFFIFIFFFFFEVYYQQ